MYDFHIHSEYSVDSNSSMEDLVIAAIKNNLKSICFTDHVDFNSTKQNIDFVFRTSDYFRNVNQVKYKYKKDIEILAGVEIGMQPHLFDKYNRFLENNHFDFVLMAIHSVNKIDIHGEKFTKDKDPIDAITEYYNDIYACIEGFNNFDILAHIDYIDRYFDNYNSMPKLDEYLPLVEKILKLIIKNGKGIEVNTSGIRYGLDYFHPKKSILKLYKDLGGEIITIGSDAHSIENVGHCYKTAERMLRDLGFKYIHIFKDRKRFPININPFI